MDDTKDLIGVVGVGRMGIAIVKHLQQHGYAVIAHDIGAAQRDTAREAGAQIAEHPAALGAATRFAIIAVGYDDEATEVMLGENGLLKSMTPGSVIAVSSTATPDHVRWLSDRAAERGITLVDAPICRGQRAADAGTMLSLVGATEQAFAIAEPVYRSFCSDVMLLGPVGAGQFGKALNNFLLWVNGIALIEAGRLSEANGMDLVKLRDALLISSGGSDALKNWENVSFLWALKDMQIVMKMADSAELAMPIAGAIKELVKDGLRVKRNNPPDWTGRLRTGA
jgi:3-hydroxyisobutyrate dehydrogenase